MGRSYTQPAAIGTRISSPVPPDGTVKANGQWLLKSAYPKLHAKVGDAKLNDGILTYQGALTSNSFTNITLGADSNLTVPSIACRQYAFGNNIAVTYLVAELINSVWVAISSDEKKWKITAELPVTTATVNGVFFENGYFFLMCTNALYASTDGISWTQILNQTCCDVAFGNSIWVFMTDGTNTNYFTTTDLSTFTTRSKPSNDVCAVKYTTRFVAIRSGVTGTYVSTDGINWSVGTNLSNNSFSNNNQSLLIKIGSNLFVPIQSATLTVLYSYSTDAGATWTNGGTKTAGAYMTNLIFDGTRYIASVVPAATGTSFGQFSTSIAFTTPSVLPTQQVSSTDPRVIYWTGTEYMFCVGDTQLTRSGQAYYLRTGVTGGGALGVFTTTATTPQLTPFAGASYIGTMADGTEFVAGTIEPDATNSSFFILIKDDQGYFNTVRLSGGALGLANVASVSLGATVMLKKIGDTYNGLVVHNDSGNNIRRIYSVTIDAATFVATAPVTLANYGATARSFIDAGDTLLVGTTTTAITSSVNLFDINTLTEITRTGYGTAFTTTYGISVDKKTSTIVITGLHSTNVYELKISRDGGKTWSVVRPKLLNASGGNVGLAATFYAWVQNEVCYLSQANVLYKSASFDLMYYSSAIGFDPNNSFSVFISPYQSTDYFAFADNETAFRQPLISSYGDDIVFSGLASLNTDAAPVIPWKYKNKWHLVQDFVGYGTSNVQRLYGTIVYPYDLDTYFRAPYIEDSTAGNATYLTT